MVMLFSLAGCRFNAAQPLLFAAMLDGRTELTERTFERHKT